MSILFAFCAQILLALYFVKAGIKSALAPLCALGSTVLWFTFFGCMDQLLVGGWLFYLGLLAAGLWLLYQRLGQKKPLPHLGFGFWFFIGGSLAFLLLYLGSRPMFTGWDEFSLWGTASKLMITFDEMYTTAPVGWAWPVTQKPALMVFSYSFQFFAREFSEWQVYFAYSVLYLALLAALLAPFEKNFAKHWNLALPLAIFALLIPFVFQNYQTAKQVSSAYLETYGDIPLGLCFAAIFAAWYGGGKKAWPDFIPVGFALALTTLTKDIGFSLALVGAVIVGADYTFSHKKSWKKNLLTLGLLAGVVLVLFIGWEMYSARVIGADRVQSTGTTEPMSLTQMPFAFFRDLGQPDEFFTYITGSMVRFFFTARANMLGSGAMLFALGYLLLALGYGMTRERSYPLFGLLASLGFVAYYWLIMLTYLYLFRPEQAQTFESIDRYVFPYYIGWLAGCLVLLCRALVQNPPGKWLPLAGKTALLGLSMLVFLRTALMIPAHFTVLGVHPDEYNQRRAFSRQVQALRQQLDPQGKTFIVTSGDIGLRWFQYCHEMLPWQVDYSFGGVILKKVEQPDGTTIKRKPTAQELAEHLQESGCTTLYIDNADEEFIQLYSQLFADGMQAYIQEDVRLYEVREQGNGISLVPVLGKDGL